MPKPNKKLYDDQKDVFKKAIKFLESKLRNVVCVHKAYIWGSLAENTFGVYESVWTDHGGDKHTCSDIDVVIIVDESKNLPKHWEKTKIKRPWCDIYKIGVFNYKGNNHIVEGLLFFPSKHDEIVMRDTLAGKEKRLL